MAHMPPGGTPELRKWHAEKFGNSHFMTSFIYRKLVIGMSNWHTRSSSLPFLARHEKMFTITGLAKTMKVNDCCHSYTDHDYASRAHFTRSLDAVRINFTRSLDAARINTFEMDNNERRTIMKAALMKIRYVLLQFTLQ